MDKNTLIQLAKEVYQLTLLFPNKEPLRYRLREAADDIVAGFIMKRNDYLQDMKLQLETIDSFFDIASCQDWTSPSRVIAIRDRYRSVNRELASVKSAMEPIILPAAAPREALKPASRIMVEPEFTPVIPAEPSPDGEIICPPPIDELSDVYPVAQPSSPFIPIEDFSVLPEIKREVPVPAVQPVADREDRESDLDLGEDGDGEENGTGLTSGQILRQNRILTFLKEKGGAQVWEIQKIFPNVSKRTIRRDFRSMLKQGLIERYGERNTTSYKLKINIS